jgi:hypothetical protein
MKFQIKLKKEDNIYEAYLTFINNIFGDNKLTDLEIRILGTLMMIKNKYKHLEAEKLNKLLFHKETKKKIREYLSISEAVLNNTTKTLRAKNFLKFDKIIIPNPEIVNNRLEITFTLNKDGE